MVAQNGLLNKFLPDYDHAYDIKSVCLRYFNACGADPEARRGECHDPETHLIPIILQAANHRRDHVSIYGDDYNTPDGTCIRDYVHVCDLVQAHSLALQQLMTTQKSTAYNLGNGEGFSVKQVIDTAKKVTGKDFSVKTAARRPGDPPILVADSSQAIQDLGWQPQYPDLTSIIQHAWQWELKCH